MSKWVKGQSGNPNGRPKTKKKRFVVQEIVDRLDCNPFEVLAHIANGDCEALGIPPEKQYIIPIRERKSAATELCKYLAPQKRSVEASSESQLSGPKQMVLVLPSNGRETELSYHPSRDVTPVKETHNIIEHEADD